MSKLEQKGTNVELGGTCRVDAFSQFSVASASIQHMSFERHLPFFADDMTLVDCLPAPPILFLP